MTKTKLPRDIQQQCLWIVRGYERCRQEYKERRQEILDASPQQFSTYKDASGEECRVYFSGGHSASRTTENRELQLEGLESTLAFKQMRAVEHARDRIGAGLPELMGDYLRAAIIQNCMDGRTYPFERLFTVGISRMGFYRCREAFLYDIANELGLL